MRLSKGSFGTLESGDALAQICDRHGVDGVGERVVPSPRQKPSSVFETIAGRLALADGLVEIGPAGLDDLDAARAGADGVGPIEHPAPGVGAGIENVLQTTELRAFFVDFRLYVFDLLAELGPTLARIVRQIGDVISVAGFCLQLLDLLKQAVHRQQAVDPVLGRFQLYLLVLEGVDAFVEPPLRPARRALGVLVALVVARHHVEILVAQRLGRAHDGAHVAGVHQPLHHRHHRIRPLRHDRPDARQSLVAHYRPQHLDDLFGRQRAAIDDKRILRVGRPLCGGQQVLHLIGSIRFRRAHSTNRKRMKKRDSISKSKVSTCCGPARGSRACVRT